jgi:Cu(I)/Ag(I) efflux system membrane fusion protein
MKSKTPAPVQVHSRDSLSNTTGVVMERLVNEGDYVSRGTILYRIADLFKIWLCLTHMKLISVPQENDKMSSCLRPFRDEFTGTIAFIDR